MMGIQIRYKWDYILSLSYSIWKGENMTKHRNKKKPWKRIVLSLFVAALLIFGGAFAFTFYQLGKINTVKISNKDEDLGIND